MGSIPKFLSLTKDLNFLIIGSNTLDIKIFDIQKRKVVKEFRNKIKINEKEEGFIAKSKNDKYLIIGQGK